MTTPGAELFGSGNLGCTRSATGVDVTGEGVPDTLLANGYDEGVDSTHKYRGPCAGGAAGRRGSVQVHVSAEYFAPVDRFTVLQGEGVALGTPVALTQSLESVLNAGAGVEHWFGGVSADQGTRYGGTVVYGAFAIAEGCGTRSSARHGHSQSTS